MFLAVRLKPGICIGSRQILLELEVGPCVLGYAVQQWRQLLRVVPLAQLGNGNLDRGQQVPMLFINDGNADLVTVIPLKLSLASS